MLTARYYTLGCKLNYAETAAIAKVLLAEGVTAALPGECANIVLINTCAVTAVAEKKCRQEIRRAISENEGAFVIVIGCYAQLHPHELAAIAGVSLVLGNDEKDKIPHYLAEVINSRQQIVHAARHREITTFFAACARGNRTRYYLKVQDGCSYYCTYCTIPYARGHARNPSIAALVDQAQYVAAQGAREIVLTGVNIGTFGHGTGESLLALLRALEQVEGIERYRIGSLEPDLVTDDIIAFCTGENTKFVPHFHIPLQAGSDDILRLMHRRYTTEHFARLVEKIKKRRPDTFLGIDVMVGFRGETPSLFEQSYAFIRSLPLSKLHVFPYSERPNTAALTITPVVAEQEKRRRTQQMLALSREKEQLFLQQNIGAVRPVLLETKTKDNKYVGYTDNYIRVEVSAEGTRHYQRNSIYPLLLTQINSDGTTMLAVATE